MGPQGLFLLYTMRKLLLYLVQHQDENGDPRIGEKNSAFIF